MGLFKKKVIKEVRDAAWGHLVNKHGIDVDTLSKDMRVVEKEGVVEGKGPVTFMRVFRLSETQQKGLDVTGWECFDQHPELVIFEGYLTLKNEADFERKRPDA
ncbi:MAG: hypothetical protein AB1597_06400 [Chloroflexota bacterium]